MKKVLLLIVLLISGCISQENMKLESNNFKENEMIPSTFTCDGENISPHLKLSNSPKETKSFALTLIDPDAPGGNFIHWLVYDIPKDINEIKQGDSVGVEVENDFGKKNYGGPCPPSGIHRYFFKIYALDVENLENINKDNFLDKVKKHTIDSGELIGLYKRK